MYTVTFQNLECHEEVSRYFETVKAARKWAAWLRKQTWTRQVAIYRGQAGAMLLERVASDHEVAA